MSYKGAITKVNFHERYNARGFHRVQYKRPNIGSIESEDMVGRVPELVHTERGSLLQRYGTANSTIMTDS